MPVDRGRKLSKHYILGDLLVDNNFPDLANVLAPEEPSIQNLERLTRTLDLLCDQFPPGFFVLSGYRDYALNEACRTAGLPASVNSLHLVGCAADVAPKNRELDLEVVYEWVREQARGDFPVQEAVFYPKKGVIHIAIADPDQSSAKRILIRT